MLTRIAIVSALLVWRAAAGQPPAVMADMTVSPRVAVEWRDSKGELVRLEGERGYRSLADKTELGRNIECFVAMGGTRLEKGCGDPHGAIVKVGLVKKDPLRPFFDDIPIGGVVTITLDRIRMNQAVEPRPRTGLLYERYALNDLTACGLDGSARILIVTADPEDRIRAKVQAGSALLGGLDGAPGHGRIAANVEADGSVTMTVSFPYPLLRHIKEPNLRTKPGAFFEPEQFHVEMELVATAAKEAGR